MTRVLHRLLACSAILLLGSLTAHAEDLDAAPKTARQRVLRDSVAKVLTPFNLNVGLDGVLYIPVGPGNAAEHYAKLEILYPQEKMEDDLHVSPESQGVQAILAASKIADCQLTPEYYPQMESGTSKQPDGIVFLAYATALLKYAEQRAEANEFAAANEAYQAGLIWSWHLSKDRPNLVTLLLAISIGRKTAQEYAPFLRRHMKYKMARGLDEYLENMKTVRYQIQAKSQVLIGDFRNFNCLHAAVLVATKDADPLWRQEAVVRLGVLRHGAKDPGRDLLVKDKAMQALAESTLMHVANNDEKPWIRQLAIWSVQNITPDRFAELRRTLLSTALNPVEEEGADTPRESYPTSEAGDGETAP